MEEETSSGEVIDKAYDVLEKTYADILSMKNEFEKTLREFDPSLAITEDYSYGSNRLVLKRNHTFIYARGGDEDDFTNQFVVAMVVIFRDTPGDISRVSLDDEPELWVGTVETTNYDKKLRYWDIHGMLGLEDRQYLAEKTLNIGGDVHHYYYKSEEGNDIWEGKFIGYPLTEVKDAEFIRDKILKKLLSASEDTGK